MTPRPYVDPDDEFVPPADGNPTVGSEIDDDSDLADDYPEGMDALDFPSDIPDEMEP